jgi:PAS domain S-box-containing protein
MSVRRRLGGEVGMELVSHEEAARMLAAHLAPMFEQSPDGVYVWLDEEHWVCNERFASILGYASAAELNDTPGLLQRFVHEDDQGMFSWNYWNRVQALAFPATFRFRGVRKDGTEVPLETDMIPMAFGGHTFAYHFVRTVG